MCHQACKLGPISSNSLSIPSTSHLCLGRISPLDHSGAGPSAAEIEGPDSCKLLLICLSTHWLLLSMDCPWCGVISRGTTTMEGVSSLLLLPQRVEETLIRCSVSVLLPEPLPPPYHLREVQVTILNHSRCYELLRIPSLHPFNNSDLFCAGAEDGSADTCGVSVPPVPLQEAHPASPKT